MKNSYIDQVEAQRRLYFKVGLIAALAFVIIALNSFVIYDSEQEIVVEEEIWDDIQIAPPRIKEQRAAPPPPPPPTPLNTVFEIVEEPEPEVKPILDTITAPQKRLVVRMPTAETPPPPPSKIIPKPKQPDEIGFLLIAEEMPIYGDCTASDLSKEERQTCSNQALLGYLAKNIRYPAIARENGISGTVVVQFIVNKKGQISDIEVVKDIGGGCGREAIRAVKEMGNWKPGLQRGIPVNVKMTLPVKFRLQ